MSLLSQKMSPAHFVRLMLLLASAPLGARTHVVTVQDNSFSPANIVIEAGDTVRWVNQGPGAHNVYAVGKFRCANGCDADGGNGSAAANNWVAEVTFRVPETVAYECQPHVQFGMVGTVVVQTPSSGTTHSIGAQADNSFLPDDLTILAGDVVFFHNQAGEHNFRADDDSLICADGCEGDGQLVDTDPTGFSWENYVRFDTPGDIPYHCANPAHSGQTGILRVLSDVLFADDFE